MAKVNRILRAVEDQGIKAATGDTEVYFRVNGGLFVCIGLDPSGYVALFSSGPTKLQLSDEDDAVALVEILSRCS
jgi:hypothetical protein